MYLIMFAEIIDNFGNPKETSPVMVCEDQTKALEWIDRQNKALKLKEPNCDETFYLRTISVLK